MSAISLPKISLAPYSGERLISVRELFLEYQRSLGIDLFFQGFEKELASLPGEYAQPKGLLTVALVDGVLAGCCGFRPLPHSDHLNACEMKRLFVRPAFRRFGLGRRLVEHMLGAAQLAGYNSILLDTLSDMESARALYQEVGFVEIPPCYYNPIAGAHYLKAAW
jgi:GNAT superfamily N-acetyltransferase